MAELTITKDDIGKEFQCRKPGLTATVVFVDDVGPIPVVVRYSGGTKGSVRANGRVFNKHTHDHDLIARITKENEVSEKKYTLTIPGPEVIAVSPYGDNLVPRLLYPGGGGQVLDACLVEFPEEAAKCLRDWLQSWLDHLTEQAK